MEIPRPYHGARDNSFSHTPSFVPRAPFSKQKSTWLNITKILFFTILHRNLTCIQTPNIRFASSFPQQKYKMKKKREKRLFSILCRHVAVSVSPSDLPSYGLAGPGPTSGLGSQMVLSPGGGSGSDMPVEEASRKREVRLMKNREAARECRRKKKEYIKCLESRVAVLENQNKALIDELKSLKELYCQKGDWSWTLTLPPLFFPLFVLQWKLVLCMLAWRYYVNPIHLCSQPWLPLHCFIPCFVSFTFESSNVKSDGIMDMFSRALFHESKLDNFRQWGLCFYSATIEFTICVAR